MLELKTLGAFQLYWQGKPEILGKQTNSSIVKLLLLLLTNAKTGITRSELIRRMYYARDIEDVGVNLRVTVYRLRQTLKKIGIPCEDGADYIEIRNGIYYWNNRIPVHMDVEEFEELAAQAVKETDEEMSLQLCRQAMLLYDGEYLPAFSTEEWVIVRQTKLMELFHALVLKGFQILIGNGEYQKAYDLTERAALLYPYEEYQIFMMDSLMAMNRRAEAIKLYEETTDRFYREMSAEPSRQMKECFKRISNHAQATKVFVDGIQERLEEDEQDCGAAYYVLPSFIDNYRFVRQLVRRTNQSAYVMVVMLKDTDGVPLGTDDARFQEATAVLEEVMSSALRKSDIFTRYNRFTFMALLMCTDEEGCQIAFERIVRKFRKQCGYKKIRLRLKSFSVSGEAEGFF